MVVETVNVLSSRVTHNLPRQEIHRHLGNIFSLRGFRIPQKNTYRRALELWVATPPVRDFVDALSVAQMERLKIRASLASIRTSTASRRLGAWRLPNLYEQQTSPV